MFEIVGWAENSTDFKGKDKPEIYYVLLNGQEVALSKADMLTQLKLSTPKRSKPEPKTPLLDAVENGHTVER